MADAEPMSGIELRESLLAEIRKEVTRTRRPFTRKARAVFLEAIGRGFSVRDACMVAGVGESTVYNNRRTDEKFAEQWQLAMERSIDPVEHRMADIALTGDANSMATIRAAELFMQGRSARHRKGGGASATLKQGRDGQSINLSVNSPFSD